MGMKVRNNSEKPLKHRDTGGANYGQPTAKK